MIDRMTKYSFILLSGEEGALIDQLQSLGLVDITRSEKPVDEESSKLSGEIDLIQGIVHGLKNINLPVLYDEMNVYENLWKPRYENIHIETPMNQRYALNEMRKRLWCEVTDG